MAYFANAGRVTMVLPCQNFDECLVSNSLHTHQVSFLLDLPAPLSSPWDDISLRKMQLRRRPALTSLGSHVLPHCHRLHCSPTRPALSLAPPTSQRRWALAVLLAVPVRILMAQRLQRSALQQHARYGFSTTTTLQLCLLTSWGQVDAPSANAIASALASQSCSLQPNESAWPMGAPPQQCTSVSSHSNSCLIGRHALTRLMTFPDLFQNPLIPWGVPLSPWGVLSWWFQFCLLPSIHPTGSLALLFRRRYRVHLPPRTNLPIWISSPSPTRRSLNNSRSICSTQQFAAVVLHLTICGRCAALNNSWPMCCISQLLAVLLPLTLLQLWLFQFLLIPWGVPLGPWGVLLGLFQFLLIPWGISLSPWGVLPHLAALCGVRSLCKPK